MLVYSSSGPDRRMKEQGREESKAASTKDAVTGGGSRGQLIQQVPRAAPSRAIEPHLPRPGPSGGMPDEAHGLPSWQPRKYFVGDHAVCM